MQLDTESIARCVPGEAPAADHITLRGPAPASASAFDVDGLLAETAGYSIAAIDRFGAARGVPTVPRVLDRAHLLAFCTTHVELNGEPVPAWAELSGVYPTRDGRHLQIHCNFAHHAAGVVQLLGSGSDRPSVAAAIAERDAFDLEDQLIGAGMIAAVVRTLDEWDAHPHDHATIGLPVLSVERVGDATPIVHLPQRGAPPLHGLRVLDCSRVLAGPVAGQVLAASGADVLRVGADHLPSVPVGVMSTGFGKRNTSLDLRTPRDAEAMDTLLGDADIWIDAYRPHALERLGYTPERAAALRPGIVVVQISAFDWTGPWAGRRGYDSIVQSTTGVRHAGGVYARDALGQPTDPGPLGLPVQALDYATGFMAAGVAAQLAAHQREVGGSWLARLSLLRTRNLLVGRRPPEPFVPAAVEVDPRHLHRVDSDFGALTSVLPVIGAVGSAPQRLGTSPPVWRS